MYERLHSVHTVKRRVIQGFQVVIIHLLRLYLAFRQARASDISPCLNDMMVDDVDALDEVSVAVREMQSDMTNAATSIKNMSTRSEI